MTQSLWINVKCVFGWLQINPQKFRINNLFINKDSLNVYLGLTAKPVISFEQPTDKISAMPYLGGFSKQQGFSIFLDARLNYDSLGWIMNSQIKGKEFTFKKGFIKKKFVIEDCSIYGGGFDKMVIKVVFSGTNDGVVYLTGKPVYDDDKKVIEIADIDFDIKSKNILLGSADWLFDKKITKEISKYARFELKAYIDSAKININQQLNQELMPGIRSAGNIKDIKLIKVYPMQEHLVIRSNCTGSLAVKVESIDFTL